MLSRQAQECIDAMRAANMVEGFRNPQLFAQIIDGSRIAQQSDKKMLEIPVSVLRDARIEISQITDTAELVTLLPKEADDSRGVSNVHVVYIHGGGYVFPAVPPTLLFVRSFGARAKMWCVTAHVPSAPFSFNQRDSFFMS